MALKLVFLTTHPSLAVRAVAENQQIIGLSSYRERCPDMGGSTQWGAIKTRIGRHLHDLKGEEALDDWARAQGIPFCFYYCDQVEAFIQWLTRLKPDLLVTCQAPLLPESVFSIPQLGSINIHYSLLPNYRGGSPLLWQVTNGEKVGGVTIHQIDQGIDTGPVIRQVPVALIPGSSEQALNGLLERVVSRLLPEVLREINQLGKVPNATEFARQQAQGSVFAGNPDASSLLEFINWNHWPIEKIWRVLRFMEYWPARTGIPRGWRYCCRWKVGQILSRQRCSSPVIRRFDKNGTNLLLQLPTGVIELAPEVCLSAAVKGAAHLLRPSG